MAIFRNANLQRDAFAQECPATVVFWLNPTATAAFAREAPDLWHWRVATFSFQAPAAERQDLANDLIGTPFHKHDSLPFHEQVERRAVLRDLLAELELSKDAASAGSKARQAALYTELALTCFGQNLMEAIGHLERSLRLSREIGDRRGEGSALGNLGNAYAALGKVEKAIGYYEQYLAIAREMGDRRGEGSALGNLGIAYYLSGQVEKAIGYYEQHLAIAREIGDRRGEGSALGNLGNAYDALGQVEKAIGYYEQHLQIGREIDDRPSDRSAPANLGHAYAALDHWP